MTPLHIINGDSITALRSLPDQSAQCCVTSPPYWGLRSYLPKDHPDKAREIGSEATPEAYVETMVQVFREVRRCLHDSGTLWLNLGDSYNAGTSAKRKSSKNVQHGYWENGGEFGDERVNCPGLAPKQLCMIPWRVALALQADGWWVRSVIVWHKRSCMPESVTDRPTNSWEPIFLLAKSQKYYYDAEAVREPSEANDETVKRAAYGRYNAGDGQAKRERRTGKPDFLQVPGNDYGGAMRNQRNVWSLGPEPYSEAHFATFPTEIPKRAILAGTSAKGCCPKCFAPWERVVDRKAGEYNPKEGRNRVAATGGAISGGTERCTLGKTDQVEVQTIGWQPGCKCNAGEPIPCTVLDPFGGSGTTGQVAIELGRKAVLIELNSDYVNLVRERCNTTPGLMLS
jgi:DNA modification methylase